MNYYIKRPAADRHIYSIYTQVLRPDGITKNHTLKLPEVDAINDKLLAGKITRQQAELAVVALKQRLSNKPDTSMHPDNEKMLQIFFVEYFRSRINIRDKQATVNKYTRAVKLLGMLSLQECTQAEAVDKLLSVKHAGKQAEAAHKLNTLFRWSGRLIKLPIAKKPDAKLAFISESELAKLLPFLEPVVADAVVASFYSGLHVGELLACRDNRLVKNSIKVSWQIDKSGQKRMPQGNVKREAFVHDKGISAYTKFANRPDSPEITRHMLNKQLKIISYKLLRRKTLTWSDLRDSYAIFLAGQNIPLKAIAKFMGITIQTCEARYGQYSNETPASTEEIAKAFK